MDAALRARGMLVYILLLRVVDAHERLDRFDYPLGIAYEIAIGIGWDQAIGDARQQACEMDDLPVGPAPAGPTGRRVLRWI